MGCELCVPLSPSFQRLKIVPSVRPFGKSAHCTHRQKIGNSCHQHSPPRRLVRMLGLRGDRIKGPIAGCICGFGHGMRGLCSPVPRSCVQPWGHTNNKPPLKGPLCAPMVSIKLIMQVGQGGNQSFTMPRSSDTIGNVQSAVMSQAMFRLR